MVIENCYTMIISKPDLLYGFEKHNDKNNVGIHEFIHKVDGIDGDMDGIPALLMDRALIAKWIKVMKVESKKIEDGQSDINPYALTNNAEFFAVVSEYFFEHPKAMAKKHPALYRILKKIFK